MRRLFQVLRAAPLTPGEQATVAELVMPEERRLFWAQAPEDQRHALEAAQAVLRLDPTRSDLARAALLHDVGKGQAPLGIVSRVLASLWRVAAPDRAPDRMRAYLDHGPRGAAALADAGSDHLVVAFARDHHSAHPPEGIDPDDWRVLRVADGEEKASRVEEPPLR